MLKRHTPVISSAYQLEEVVVITEYQDEKGLYRIAEKEVHAKLDDGTVKILHECLDSVKLMWCRELIRLGVLSATSVTQKTGEPKPYLPLREHEGESALLDIEIMQGERFKQQTILKRFNYETMEAEPVDLTDSQFGGEIYQKRVV